MSKELLPCPFCGGSAGSPVCTQYMPQPCAECGARGPLTENGATAWNRRTYAPGVSALREALENTRVRLIHTRTDYVFYKKSFMELAEALGGVSTDDTGRIGEVMPVDELVDTIKQLQRNSVGEERADYFAALLTRLLATRQGRTVGYEPPEVQELWREVEKALEGKEGAK